MRLPNARDRLTSDQEYELIISHLLKKYVDMETVAFERDCECDPSKEIFIQKVAQEGSTHYIVKRIDYQPLEQHYCPQCRCAYVLG